MRSAGLLCFWPMRAGKEDSMQTPIQAPTTAACECPECAAAIAFPRPPLCGEVVRCAGCSAELEVTSTAPITLSLAPEVEEDWGE